MSALSLKLFVPQDVVPGNYEIRMAGEQADPLFCLADLCAVIDKSNPRQVAARLDEDEKTTVQIVDGRPGHGPQEMTYVNMPGMFRVILTSRNDENFYVKRLRRWVCHDVLPTIYRHGCYPAPDQQAQQYDRVDLALAKAERAKEIGGQEAGLLVLRHLLGDPQTAQSEQVTASEERRGRPRKIERKEPASMTTGREPVLADRILDLLRSEGRPMTPVEISRHLNVDNGTVRSRISRLKRGGLVEAKGHGYRLPDLAADWRTN